MFDKCSSQRNKGLDKQNAHSLIKVTVGGNSKIPLNVCFIKWVIEAAIYMFQTREANQEAKIMGYLNLLTTI